MRFAQHPPTRRALGGSARARATPTSGRGRAAACCAPRSCRSQCPAGGGGADVVLHGTATTQTVHNASPVATHGQAEHARTAGAYNPSSQTPSPLAHQAAIPCLRRAARQVGSPGQLGGGKANEGGHVDAHAAVAQPRHQVVECGAVLALKSGECRTRLGQPRVGAPRANAQEQIGL